MKRPQASLACVAVLLSSLALTFIQSPAAAQGDPQGAAARAVSGAAGEAVIQVRLVIKYRFVSEGEEASEEEGTSEVSGTVIDPSGLAVCALSEVDPSHRMKMMGEEDEDFRFEADVVSVHYVLGEGREIPAKIVLRDRDLDLAFVRPTEAQPGPFTAVDLGQASLPQVMDELVVLGRLGEAANRAPYVAMDRVTAIVTKPRTLYVAGISTWVAGLGIPAFTLDGKVVGITVMRSIPTAAGYSGRGGTTSMPVVLPAADILRVAKQAPAN